MEHPVRRESSTSNSTPPWKYDVFLSFAGKDTRLKFMDHLQEAFNRSGIKTFRDDEDLVRGGDIKQDLFQAIQDSLCAIVIISENYANSTWCLDELQKILELGRRVFPIFYDVDPADVRHQRQPFSKAMDEHEKKFRDNTKKVQNWRNTLFEIANLSGWDTRGKHEADLIKNIIGEVWTYLCSKLPSYDDNLIGIESRVGDIMPLLEIGLDDNRFVGIWGMGGVGKTTLARVIFEKLSDKFEVCSFLANVRETLLQSEGLVSLQKRFLSHLKIKNTEITDDYEGMKIMRKLLHNKKVLLVLDDVDDMSQLKNLAQRPSWFGKGSRIIITTRNSQLLTSCGVEKHRTYEMTTMKEDESLQLFANKAFHKDHPEENYLDLSKLVVEYAGGLPLGLEVLGSFLCGRSRVEWRDALNRLKEIPDKDILQVLQISYDGLNEEEKKIFLDIACFFKGWPKKQVTRILECCDLHATIGIKVLIEKTLLVETKDFRLEMHDLLEDLGRYIVHQESPNVGKRSRLWKFEDIKEVLENNKGYKAVQAIVLKDYCENPDNINVHPEAFSKMSNIRILLLDRKDNHLILPRGLQLCGALKVVRWSSFPFKALPLGTPFDKLVDIQMRYSKVTQLWNGIQLMDKLKFLDLSCSEDFIETPDFSGVPYLEHLRLAHCTTLVKVHPSLGKLKHLVEVDLQGCLNVEILPWKLETNSLMKLDLGQCEKVAELPEFGEGMNKLSYLDLSCTAITRLPKSLGSLIGLTHLHLNGCEILNFDKFWKTRITRQISCLNVIPLTVLHLRHCSSSDGSIPDDFGTLSSLIVLDLSFNDFVNLPSSCFSSLSRLLFLSLNHCKRLKSLPRLPPRLIRLEAYCCDSMEPLSDRLLWNLIASLDHEYRARAKYVLSDVEYDDDHDVIFRWVFKLGYVAEDNDINSLVFKDIRAEYLPLRDFCASIPGCEIPSWFLNKEYDTLDEYYESFPIKGREYEIKVNIPGDLHDSEWSGIIVCLHVSGVEGLMINWSSKAAEDDDYRFKENVWAHYLFQWPSEIPHLCMMVLELNEETCWQHLRPHHNSLHIKLSIYNFRFGDPLVDANFHILGSGWRVICKEEIKEWCPLNHFNQLTLPQLTSPDDKVQLPSIVRDYFIKVYEELRIP